MSTSPRLTWLSQNVTGRTIVDIGFAGVYKTSKAHNLIRHHNPHSTIIPLDFNIELVRKHQIPGSVVANGFQLPLKNKSVDSIVIAEVLEHLSDWISFVQEAARVVKPNGSLYITTPNPSALFRQIRYWLIPKKPSNKGNLKNYLGFHEHIQFIDPLSLANVVTQLGFQPTLTTTNLSIPYLPKSLKDPHLSFWPLNLHMSQSPETITLIFGSTQNTTPLLCRF